MNGGLVGRHFSSYKPKIALDRKEDINEPLTALAARIKKSFKSGIGTVLSHVWRGDNRKPGLFDVMASSVNIMQDQITRSRMAGDPPDLILVPRLERLGLLEFYRATEAIREGKDCVRQAEHGIRKLIQ